MSGWGETDAYILLAKTLEVVTLLPRTTHTVTHTTHTVTRAHTHTCARQLHSIPHHTQRGVRGYELQHRGSKLAVQADLRYVRMETCMCLSAGSASRRIVCKPGSSCVCLRMRAQADVLTSSCTCCMHSGVMHTKKQASAPLATCGTSWSCSSAGAPPALRARTLSPHPGVCDQ